ncbi:MAG: hypothetical protein QOH21_261, partial [Acidobacteriota bacterium]|nr:hypothetical protein [Acidobacteriota bacterium]
LSVTTEKGDRGNKWMHYQRIPSLVEYVLVSQEPRIEIFRRTPAATWEYLEVREGNVRLASGPHARCLDALRRPAALKRMRFVRYLRRCRSRFAGVTVQLRESLCIGAEWSYDESRGRVRSRRLCGEPVQGVSHVAEVAAISWARSRAMSSVFAKLRRPKISSLCARTMARSGCWRISVRMSVVSCPRHFLAICSSA